jgi:hypothetical protein
MYRSMYLCIGRCVVPCMLNAEYTLHYVEKGGNLLFSGKRIAAAETVLKTHVSRAFQREMCDHPFVHSFINSPGKTSDLLHIQCLGKAKRNSSSYHICTVVKEDHCLLCLFTCYLQITLAEGPIDYRTDIDRHSCMNGLRDKVV